MAYPLSAVMTNVLLSPSATVCVPSGVILPPIPADAVTVYSFFWLLPVTSILQEADILLPSWLSAVMVALPSPIAAMKPSSTSATWRLSLLHFNCLFSALSGVTVASKSNVFPTSRDASAWLSVIFSTFTVSGFWKLAAIV